MDFLEKKDKSLRAEAGQGPRILVVEDDPQLSGNIALILKMEGYQVCVAANGQDGLVAVETYRPHLILCDILMPGIDGYAFHKMVADKKLLSGIPFIFISALNDHIHLRKGMQAGADDYLCKPFTAEELVTSVQTRLLRFAELMTASDTEVLTEQALQALRRVSQRELEILALVAAGVTSREIAGRLHISPKTVDIHRSRLMRKLGAGNAAMLAHWATLAECAKRRKLIGLQYAGDAEAEKEFGEHDISKNS